MLDPCFTVHITVVDLDFYNYNKINYINHRVRDVNYWLLGRGSLYPKSMLAKTRNNIQLAII